MGQPDKDYVSLLNEQNNALKPLTSIVVLNRITTRRQCDHAGGQGLNHVDIYGFEAH